MAWLLLVAGGLFEVAWAVGLKYTRHFTQFWPTVWVVVTMVASVALLELATRRIPLGTAYAVWTGIGAVGAALLGMVLFHESRELPRLVCLALVVLGIVGLHAYEKPLAGPG